MNAYVIVLSLFMAMLLFIGWRAAKVAKNTAADYYVAGRTMSRWVIAGTYAASFLSAGSFLGTIGYNYAYGWAAVWQLLGTLSALFFLGILLSAKFWRFGYYNEGYTLPDVFALRYSQKWSRGVFSCVILCMYTFGMAAMYMGFNSVLGTVTDLPYMGAIAIGAIVVLVYTISGGSRAVAWTDTACFVIMLGSMVVMIPVILYLSGGFEELAIAYANTPPRLEGTNWAEGQELVSITNSYLTATVSLAWFSIWLFGNISQPHQITRMYLAKNEKEARSAVAMVIIPFALIYLSGMLIGSYARVIEPSLSKIDMAFPMTVMHIFPPVISAIILMGIIAAIMSTASTMLIICSQCTGYDIYKSIINPEASEKKILTISRSTMLICTVISLIVAYLAQTLPGLLFLWSSAFSVMGAAVFPSLLAAFYWKRANAAGNLASMLVGMIITLIWFGIPELRPFGLHPILPGLVVSTAVLIIVSLATPKPEQKILDTFFNENMRRFF
jgi:SSS family transporter